MLRTIKKLLGIVVLGLFLITPSQADDIRDFQIEGMSIGDSFLDFMNESEIKNKSSEIYYYKSRKYVYYFYPSLDFLKTYDGIQITIKGNDKDYKIHGLDGVINFKNDINSCHKKQNEIVEEISKIFEDAKKSEKSYKSRHDPSGKSTKEKVIFTFNSGDEIQIVCANWEENLRIKNNWTEGLSVIISTNEVLNWLRGN